MKRTVTQEDLDLNPDLVDQGVQVGEEIEIPENEGTEKGTGDAEGGPGGGQPQGPETGKPKDPPDEP